MNKMRGVAACYGCKNVFDFDIDTVPVIIVDPVTNWPPDLRMEDGEVVRIPDHQANPEVRERCTEIPVCPDCAKGVNKRAREKGQAPPFTSDGLRLRNPS